MQVRGPRTSLEGFLLGILIAVLLALLAGWVLGRLYPDAPDGSWLWWR